MSRAVIHIGAGKTGTTAIQHALSYNQSALAEQNVIYPRLKGVSPSFGLIDHNRLAYALFDDRELSNLDQIKDEISKIANTDCTLLLSAEVFYMRPFESGFSNHEDYLARKRVGIKKLVTMLSSFEHIQVICYVRRQDLWLESIYNERVKQGKHADQSFECFVKDVSRKHFAEQLDLWAEVIGFDNVIVRPYEKSQLDGGDVVQDFANLLGLKGIRPAPRKLATANPRLSRNVMEFQKIAWRVEKDSLKRAMIQEALWRISEEMLAREPEPEGWQELMTHKQRLELLDSFTEANRYLANVYMGCTNGDLFQEEVRQVVQSNYYPGLSTDALLEISIRLNQKLSQSAFRRRYMIQRLRRWINRQLPFIRPLLSPLGKIYERLRAKSNYGYL